MALIGESDFEAWLTWRSGRDLPQERIVTSETACNGCGALEGKEPVRLLHGRCIVCLAQEFGWDQASAAGAIVSTMRLKLAQVPYLPDSLLQVVADAALTGDGAWGG